MVHEGALVVEAVVRVAFEGLHAVNAAASVRSGLEALVQGTLRADGLAERVLALNEVAHWWNQPRARTLVRIGATQ